MGECSCVCCCPPPKGAAYHKLARQEGSCGDEGDGFLTLHPISPGFSHPTSPTSACSAIHIQLCSHWRAGEEVGRNGLSGRLTDEEKYFCHEKLRAVLFTVAMQSALVMNHKWENGIGRKSELNGNVQV